MSTYLTIHSLPNEVLCLCLGYLNLVDAVSAQKVCSRWKQILSGQDAFHKEIFENISQEVIDHKKFNEFLSLYKYSPILILNGHNTSNLKESNFNRIGKVWNSIQVLKLHDSEVLKENYWKTERCLIQGGSLERIVRENLNICSISLKGCPELDFKALKTIAKEARNLNEVELASTNWLSAEVIIAFLKNNPNLISLRINGEGVRDYLTKETLIALGEYGKNLTTLHLDGMSRHVSSADLAQSLGNLTQLQDFLLNGVFLKDSDVATLMASTPNLTKCSLGTWNTTSSSSAKVFKSVPNLKTLNLKIIQKSKKAFLCIPRTTELSASKIRKELPAVKFSLATYVG